MDEGSGSVKFVYTNSEAARLGVSVALTHNFMKQVRSSVTVLVLPACGVTMQDQAYVSEE